MQIHDYDLCSNRNVTSITLFDCYIDTISAYNAVDFMYLK